MICTNCYECEYTAAKTELAVTINGVSHVLHELDCETCPSCGDITFTHSQSLAIDKKRVALEFGEKPILTPIQLKNLRRFLDMKLDDICDLLHVGRNTYGRWERGEVGITPSMNLLVHSLIERVPDASVNLLDSVRTAAIKKANTSILSKHISFGEYIREVIAATRLIPDVVCGLIGIETAELVRIQNNEVAPEKIAHEVTAKIAHFFGLTCDTLKKLLNEALTVFDMKGSVSTVHACTTCYGDKAVVMQTSSVNKILEKLAQQKGARHSQQQVSEVYLAKVFAIMTCLNETGV